MKCVANFVKERILDSHSTQNTRPQRIVCATHFIGCLFKRWRFVTLKWKSWLSLLGVYSEADTHFHLALKACRDQFGKCLEASKARMHLYLQPLSDTNLRLLMEQLELVAARNEPYAKEVPYVCLLEMAIEVSGRFRTELPLKDLDEKDPLHKSFNLDSWLRWSNAVLLCLTKTYMLPYTDCAHPLLVLDIWPSLNWCGFNMVRTRIMGDFDFVGLWSKSHLSAGICVEYVCKSILWSSRFQFGSLVINLRALSLLLKQLLLLPSLCGSQMKTPSHQFYQRISCSCPVPHISLIEQIRATQCIFVTHFISMATY